MSDAYYAVIDPDSPRRPSWLEAFEDDAVELEGAEPVEALGPGGRTARFYKARVASLDQVRLARLCEALAARWHLPAVEVALDLVTGHGLPILAEDVRICSDPDEGRAYFARRRLP